MRLDQRIYTTCVPTVAKGSAFAAGSKRYVALLRTRKKAGSLLAIVDLPAALNWMR